MVELNAAEIVPQVTWGTSPEMVTAVDGRVPDPDREKDPVKRDAMERALLGACKDDGTPTVRYLEGAEDRVLCPFFRDAPPVSLGEISQVR